MNLSFRAHIFSGIINLITLGLTSIALFTCYWLDKSTATIKYLPKGLPKTFYLSNQALFSVAGCYHLPDSWDTATTVFMFIAFTFQILMVLHLLVTCVHTRFNAHVLKVDSSLIGISTFSLIIAIVTFGASYAADDMYYNIFELGYSYVLACIATGFSILAGLPVGHAYRKIHHCGDCECGYFDTW